MDPDKFQMKDLKRRMTRAEKQNEYRRNDLGALAKRVREIEDLLDEQAKKRFQMEQFALQAQEEVE